MISCIVCSVAETYTLNPSGKIISSSHFNNNSLTLLFITNSKALNFFKSKTISFGSFVYKSPIVASIHILQNSSIVIFSKYSLSLVATSDNLFKVFKILGLNSFCIYGISSFLILFLLYIFSKLLLSILGSKLFCLQYSSISFLSVSNNGLIYFSSLIASIPFKPDNPLPLKIFNNIVSTLSLILCAVAIFYIILFLVRLCLWGS